uniref:CNH domain-containing protein n=1 Tax=Rhabditophanes sp. KR3021 TaxID=114890 RepID=A0AC35U7Z4_9BILA
MAIELTNFLGISRENEVINGFDYIYCPNESYFLAAITNLNAIAIFYSKCPVLPKTSLPPKRELPVPGYKRSKSRKKPKTMVLPAQLPLMNQIAYSKTEYHPLKDLIKDISDVKGISIFRTPTEPIVVLVTAKLCLYKISQAYFLQDTINLKHAAMETVLDKVIELSQVNVSGGNDNMGEITSCLAYISPYNAQQYVVIGGQAGKYLIYADETKNVMVVISVNFPIKKLEALYEAEDKVYLFISGEGQQFLKTLFETSTDSVRNIAHQTSQVDVRDESKPYQQFSAVTFHNNNTVMSAIDKESGLAKVYKSIDPTQANLLHTFNIGPFNGNLYLGKHFVINFESLRSASIGHLQLGLSMYDLKLKQLKVQNCALDAQILGFADIPDWVGATFQKSTGFIVTKKNVLLFHIKMLNIDDVVEILIEKNFPLDMMVAYADTVKTPLQTVGIALLAHLCTYPKYNEHGIDIVELYLAKIAGHGLYYSTCVGVLIRFHKLDLFRGYCFIKFELNMSNDDLRAAVTMILKYDLRKLRSIIESEHHDQQVFHFFAAIDVEPYEFMDLLSRHQYRTCHFQLSRKAVVFSTVYTVYLNMYLNELRANFRPNNDMIAMIEAIEPEALQCIAIDNRCHLVEYLKKQDTLKASRLLSLVTPEFNKELNVVLNEEFIMAHFLMQYHVLKLAKVDDCMREAIIVNKKALACSIGASVAVNSVNEILYWGKFGECCKRQELLFTSPERRNTQVKTMQLGGVTKPVTIEIFSISNVLKYGAIAAVNIGCSHIMITTTKGIIFALGNNHHGQCGLMDQFLICNPTIVNSCETRAFIDLSCGSFHTMAIDEYGQVWGCGWNFYGQLGLGHTNKVRTFTKVFGLPKDVNFVKVACGQAHSILLGENGEVWGAGCNMYNEINGRSGVKKNPTFQNLNLPFKVKAFDAKFLQSAFISVTDEVYVCGGDLLLLVETKSKIKEMCNNAFGTVINEKTVLLRNIMYRILNNERRNFNALHRVEADYKMFQANNHVLSSISLGNNHLLVLTDRGMVAAIGRNSTGCCNVFVEENERKQFLYKKRETEMNINYKRRFLGVAAGFNTSTVITNDGKIFACGQNPRNSLGVKSSYCKPVTTNYKLKPGYQMVTFSGRCIRNLTSLQTYSRNVEYAKEIYKSIDTVTYFINNAPIQFRKRLQDILYQYFPNNAVNIRLHKKRPNIYSIYENTCVIYQPFKPLDLHYPRHNVNQAQFTL